MNTKKNTSRLLFVRNRILIPCLATVILATLFARNAYAEDSYYTVPPIFRPAPDAGPRGKNWHVQNFGPVGIGINLTKPAFTMVIHNVEAGSPAAATGKLKKGQVIESINGVVLKDRDPRMILGDIITAAETRDGVINLKIKDLGDVVVQIPVMGSYSKTWPLNCPKSDKIVRKLADYLAAQEKPTWGSALFMLSTGEEKDLAVVRKWLSGSESMGDYPWHAGYLGIAYCEYYLRTGDKSVLPAIKKMADRLAATMYNGGWSGRGEGASFNYSTGTGQMHAAGVHCITFLQLARMCGVDVDEYTFQESLKTFYRFAGHDNVPYGDGWPEGGLRDNGKTSGLAVALAAATRLTPDGESSIYAEARDHVAMKAFYATTWFHSAHTGGGIGEIWHHAAMSMLHERRPLQHRTYFDTRRWVMELSRRHDGTIGIAGMTDRYDKSASEHERSWGNYFALTYTIPRKKLIVFGAPLTQWCKQHQLPERPWGRPADDAFVQIEPIRSKMLSMDELMRETVEKDASWAVITLFNDENVDDSLLLKHIAHPEMAYRSGAMSEAVKRGRAEDFVLPLLKANDPRARHAGLLAITGMFKGRALSNNDLSPEMFEEVAKMIADPNESLWVVQAALQAMKRAPVEVIARHRDTIMAYLDHEDWFLRTRAIAALLPICTDQAHYKIVLPAVFKVMAGFTTQQALAPAGDLRNVLGSANVAVKEYAMAQLVAAFNRIPSVMQFPGGRVLADGAKNVKGRMASIMEKLPGGEMYLKTMPKMTPAAARAGGDSDAHMYTYSGTFSPNDAIMGNWHWAVWPRPKHAGEVEKMMRSWLAEYKKKGPDKNPKDVLRLGADGEVKSRTFKGYFWTDNMLVSKNESKAHHMELRTMDGIDFLIIESGGFDPNDIPEAWNKLYTIYVRAK